VAAGAGQPGGARDPWKPEDRALTPVYLERMWGKYTGPGGGCGGQVWGAGCGGKGCGVGVGAGGSGRGKGRGDAVNAIPVSDSSLGSSRHYEQAWAQEASSRRGRKLPPRRRPGGGSSPAGKGEEEEEGEGKWREWEQQ